MTSQTCSVDASTIERLIAGLERKSNGCLEWTRGTDVGGYGAIKSCGKSLKTHRLAWERANGQIPIGMCVLHHCDNPPCGQTDPTEGYPEGHLFLGTRLDNNADRVAKGRNSNGHRGKTSCRRGHLWDDGNTYQTPRGTRECRTCKAARRAKFEFNRKALAA
jgi:hypothetical protein